MSMRDNATGWEVWQWPEFTAFAKRLGVELDLPTRSLTIHIPYDGITEITQGYIGRDVPAVDNARTLSDDGVQ